MQFRKIILKTSNCEFEREILPEIGIAITRYNGKDHYRRLYPLTDFDKKEFPWAKFRIETTEHFTQENILWQSLPCSVKVLGNGRECKNRLVWQTSDDEPIETIEGKIHEKFSNWEYFIKEE